MGTMRWRGWVNEVEGAGTMRTRVIDVDRMGTMRWREWGQ